MEKLSLLLKAGFFAVVLGFGLIACDSPQDDITATVEGGADINVNVEASVSEAKVVDINGDGLGDTLCIHADGMWFSLNLLEITAGTVSYAFEYTELEVFDTARGPYSPEESTACDPATPPDPPA